MENKELERRLLRKDAGEVADAFSSANIWSKLTFRWLNPVFVKGYKGRLGASEIPPFPKSQTSEQAYTSLEQSIGSNDDSKSPLLAKAIFHTAWRSLTLNALFAGSYAIASYVGPFLIANFIRFLSTKNGDHMSYHGLVLAVIFFIAKAVESLSERQWYFGGHQIGIRIRAALLTLIYRKLLLVKSDGARNGKIVNYINADTEKVVELIQNCQKIWLLPFQVILALIILSMHLGWIPSILAILSTVLIMMSNVPLANLQKRLQTGIAETKDFRIKATSETLKNMKVLKLHAWESTFLEKIFKLRERERGWLKKFLYTKSAVVFLYWASPMFITVMTFGVCAMLEKGLSSGSIFSALATLQTLNEPIYYMPELISIIVQAKISINRLQEFLSEEDGEKSEVGRTPSDTNTMIHIAKGEYAWEASSGNSPQPTLTINEEILVTRGKKVAICGSVGSGKSSFLCSILKEMPKMSGAGIRVFGSRAYVPQTSWIQMGTVRENILFGKKMDESFYKNVIHACGLKEDINQLVHKDSTAVGERGITLSGGQKQRIQLARAIYSDADVYFLDDPFSSVDAHTKAHLFKHCLMDLLSNKTVLYVTHQLEYLAAADLVLVMRDGKVVQSGTYKDLLAKPQGEFNRLVDAHFQSLSQVKTAHCQVDDGEIDPETEARQVDDKSEISINNGQFWHTTDKDKETGRVSRKAYTTFIKIAYRGALLPIILLCHLLFQGLQIGSNYWLAWATEQDVRLSKVRLIGTYALITGGSSIFVLARALLLMAITMETAQRLFNRMMTSVFRAPMSFFDTTSSSQILDRTSTDQAAVDSDIPFRIGGLVFALVQLVSVVILMSLVAWQVSLLFVIIFAISAWYHAYYIGTARELARMVAIQKAPLLHNFSESISGIMTIRCFGQAEQFNRRNLKLIDEFSRIAFHNSGTMEWLCVRINFLFNLGFFLVLVALVYVPGSNTDPGLAGLAVTYGLNISIVQAWVIWNICVVENKMISVERILQFSSIRAEEPSDIKSIKHQRPKWPEMGGIEFRKLEVRHNPALPLVLKGISCSFPGGKRIGIVGRTGSGKSTLIQALFRLVNPFRGQVLIDGLDISTISLSDLRSVLSIIPQDPTLFQGTMRYNVDPLQRHADHQIWEVLRKCHLAEIIKQDHRRLDAPVAEEGQNWSLGQRQLICLARVLLHNRKILVMDEATASIDTATDRTIQEAIRNETSNSTVINIAHRITTVVDSDLVLVLDDGNAVECAPPAQLLTDNSSAFSKLVKEFSRSSSRS